jgi:hypothetical protein
MVYFNFRECGRYPIDKNSLCGGLNIQKREVCVKGILAQELGFVFGRFEWGFGEFLVWGGEGALSGIGRGPAGAFEAHPGTPVAPPRIPDLYDWRQAWS